MTEKSNDSKERSTKSKALKITFWSCFGVVCAVFLVGVFAFAGVFDPLEEKFDASVSALIEVDKTTDEWQTADELHYFDGDKTISKDYMEYSSPLAKKRVSCLYPGGDKNTTVEMRIIDDSGDVVVGPLALTADGYYSVSELKRNEKYTVQYRGLTPGHYTLQFE